MGIEMRIEWLSDGVLDVNVPRIQELKPVDITEEERRMFDELLEAIDGYLPTPEPITDVAHVPLCLTEDQRFRYGYYEGTLYISRT